MGSEKRRFVHIDKIGEGLSAEQIPAHFGVPSEEIQKKGNEVRTRCFLQCGKECPTGNRVLAINDAHPAKLWHCHQYGCQRGGNLVSMVSLALGGPASPKSADFWKAVDVIEAIRDGHSPAPQTTDVKEPPVHTEAFTPQSDVQINVPLAESDKQQVRDVADLYRKLTVDLENLNPSASRYVRCHRFLTPELASELQVGYLSRNTGGDRSGGTLRGKFVITIRNRDGEIVAYAGRDPEWETKHEKWLAGGRQGKEPAKWLFPRAFHRGVELYGEHRIIERMDECREKLHGIGLPVVEGAMDVMNMWETLDVPCVGILSNKAANQQVERIAELAKEVGDCTVTMLYDCDDEGDKGANLDTVKLSKRCRVQRGWSQGMYGGAFAGREPSELSIEEWNVIKAHITGAKSE